MEAKKAKNVKLGKIDSSVLAIFGKTVGYNYKALKFWHRIFFH